jgi:predicted porin
VDKADDMGYALMYNHKLSKRTNTYLGYGDNASDKAADDQVFTLGIRHKF